MGDTAKPTVAGLAASVEAFDATVETALDRPGTNPHSELVGRARRDLCVPELSGAAYSLGIFDPNGATTDLLDATFADVRDLARAYAQGRLGPDATAPSLDVPVDARQLVQFAFEAVKAGHDDYVARNSEPRLQLLQGGAPNMVGALAGLKAA